MIVLGNLFGAGLGFLINELGGVVGIYYVLMLVMLIGAVVTWFGVKEPEGTYEIKTFHWNTFWRGLYAPFKSSDFTWVFMTRLLVTMGIFTIQEFLQYYLGDVIGAPFAIAGIGQVADSPEQAVSLFLGPMLVGGVISTLAAGVISDKSGRKFIVYISGALMGIVALMFVFFHNFTLAVLMGIVFGLGYGAYESVDWAMASDVLPSMDDYAKDMGVWHVACTFPQVIATPIAGFLLDRFQALGSETGAPHLGYTAIFSLATLYFILGTLLVRQIRKVR